MNKHLITAKLIRWSVPLLNLFRSPEKWPYNLSDLEKMQEGTLGRELYLFLTSRGLAYLPKYEVHDAYHALLGYGTTVTDELKLQAFMWGNKTSTLAGRGLFILGFILFPKKRSILKSEMLKGRKAKPLRKLPVHLMVPKLLPELRKDLCID